MKVTISGTKMVIELDLIKKPQLSKSSIGKEPAKQQLLVATSSGFQPTGLEVSGKPVKVMVNAIVPAN